MKHFFTLISISLLGLSIVNCQDKDRGRDIAEIITDKNPEAIQYYLNDTASSESDYDEFISTSYFYPVDSIPKLTILNIPIQNFSSTYFDDDLGLINLQINGKENFNTLQDSLTIQFGAATIKEEDGDINYTWKDEKLFWYIIHIPSYVEEENFSCTLSIESKRYRKINEAYGGN
ncbi:hypothetical protein [Cellulophaga sp. Z1A5H]|uniref:hypothetical protein n=1 Tax=Cellulophaga sp. Z1A5H TaxID=2687291 RepID=UPI0013FDAE7E|nr:hypothetical protein [Cellulophaga sp. Z1A5H]